MELDVHKVKVLKMEALDGEIHLTQCPPEFRGVAERIVIMLYAKPLNDTYLTMTELDKKLTLRYWEEYDGLKGSDALTGVRALNTDERLEYFRNWFLSCATNPDVISRARRYLVSDAKLLIIPQNIAKHAKQAQDKWARSTYVHGSG